MSLISMVQARGEWLDVYYSTSIVMAAGSSGLHASGCRSKRKASITSFAPGYYRALNATDEPRSDPSNPTTYLSLPHGSCEGGLPSNCYLVDPVVAARNHEVSSLALAECRVIIIILP